MKKVIFLIFVMLIISCNSKKDDIKKGERFENISINSDLENKTKIKVLENQVFHSVLYENEYCYFLAKKGDFVDVTLNFNVKRLANEATIDNIFYSNDFNTYQNQLYRIKN